MHGEELSSLVTWVERGRCSMRLQEIRRKLYLADLELGSGNRLNNVLAVCRGMSRTCTVSALMTWYARKELSMMAMAIATAQILWAR